MQHELTFNKSKVKTMRKLLLSLSLIAALFSGVAFAQQYTTAETDIGTLLDDPAAAEILEKYMPGFTTNDQVSMTRSLTLESLKSFAPDMVSDEVLEKIDADLAKLSAE